MKKYLFSLLILMFSFPSAFSQQKYFSGKTYKLKGIEWYEINRNTDREFKVDTSVITVKFKSNFNKRRFEAAHSQLIILHYNKLEYGLIQKPANISIFEFANELMEDSNIFDVEINTFGNLLDDYAPNDPDIWNQWYLNAIDVPDAWNYTRGSNCTSIIIAIIGTGIDWHHEDLGYGPDSYSNIYENSGEDSWSDPDDPNTGNGMDDDNDGYVDDWKGWNFYSYNNNSLGTINLNCDYRPPNGHGTNVAGLIGAKLNNSIGVAGIAGGTNKSGVKLMSIVVSAQDSNNCKFILRNAILPDAIIYAVDQGAKIINMSIYTSETSAIDDAIDYALNQGVTLVVSAGNTNPNGGPLDYPASNPSVISVGATDITGHRANFSNYGSNLFISAPGVNMYSTVPDNEYGWYQNGSGTSFAAPVVSGIIALMLCVNPSLTPAMIKDMLSYTADETGGYTYTNGKSAELGYGQVNAKKAVEKAIGGPIEIAGPTSFCTTTMYSLTNLPSGSVATWTASPGGSVSLSYSGDGHQVTVTKINSGNITLSASVPYLCDNIILTKSNIAVGTPQASNISLWSSSNNTTVGIPMDFVAGYPPADRCLIQATDWQVFYMNATINTGNFPCIPDNGTSKNIVFQSVGTAYVQARIQNTCGWSNWSAAKPIQVNSGYSSYIISPNPAQHMITIVPNNESNKLESMKFENQSPTISYGIKQIKIYDASGKLKGYKLFNGKSTQVQMDISGISPGIYFLELTDALNHQESHKLIISK